MKTSYNQSAWVQVYLCCKWRKPAQYKREVKNLFFCTRPKYLEQAFQNDQGTHQMFFLLGILHSLF